MTIFSPSNASASAVNAMRQRFENDQKGLLKGGHRRVSWRYHASTMSTGHELLNAELPNRGWPGSCHVELLLNSTVSGKRSYRGRPYVPLVDMPVRQQTIPEMNSYSSSNCRYCRSGQCARASLRPVSMSSSIRVVVSMSKKAQRTMIV